MMDRSSLIIEKPALTKVVVMDETDGLLSGANRELANYAATHLGYEILSSRLNQEKMNRDQKAAGIAQMNDLPAALLGADIDVYSTDSVKQYQRSMVRRGWAKFLLNPEECALWPSLYLIMPAMAAAMFLLGWLGGWQSVALATIFQLPFLPVALKELRSCRGGSLILFPLVVFSSMVGLGLAVSGFGNGWTAPTIFFIGIGGMCLFDTFLKQLKKSKIHWVRVPIGEYKEEIPLFALSKMRQIHELCPSARFSIEELKADIYLPDPFLVATDSVTGKDFYFEVWDEPKFEAGI